MAPSKTSSRAPSTSSAVAMATLMSNTTKAIAIRNTKQSPLLRLPAEIRNQIFGLALGGNYIHVRTKGRDVQLHVCQTARPGEEPPQENGSSDRTTWFEKHWICYGLVKRESRNLTDGYLPDPSLREHWLSSIRCGQSLLLTSKQVHDEVALMPYALNTFVFHGEEPVQGVKAFLGALTAPQRDAITSIKVHVTNKTRNIHPPKPLHHEHPLQLSKLASLTTLTLIVEDDGYTLTGKTLRHFGQTPAIMTAAINVFELQTLTEVRVSVRLVEYLHCWPEHPFPQRMVAVLSSFAAQCKEKLLKLPGTELRLSFSEDKAYGACDTQM